MQNENETRKFTAKKMGAVASLALVGVLIFGGLGVASASTGDGWWAGPLVFLLMAAGIAGLFGLIGLVVWAVDTLQGRR